MFVHLDTDGDGLLSANNLYALRHDERERCLRPFLSSCGAEGGGAGGAGGVSRAAWCGCLRRAARPCTALARAHPAAAGGGAYVPACDARGYYRPRQCHAALAVCWCVDAHGQELPGSRTKGAPACPGECDGPVPYPYRFLAQTLKCENVWPQARSQRRARRARKARRPTTRTAPAAGTRSSASSRASLCKSPFISS